MGNAKQLHELQQLARDTSLQARMDLVEVIGDLFSSREQVLSDRERALMNGILQKLIHDFEMSVRVELAKRLASQPGAPPALITALANDTIEVARPLLMRSEVLCDVELIEIVRNRTRQHQLAIAMRHSVSEPVSDALVENGDDDVVRVLLENNNARISQATMAYLVDQARRLDAFQEPLVKREDLGPDLARRLYTHVSAALRVHILERYAIVESDLDDALEAIACDVAPSRSDEESEAGAPSHLARRIAEERGIDATLLIKVLRRGEIPLFEALFAEFSGIPQPRLQQVVYGPGGKALAVVCRAMGVDKSNFTPIFLLSRKACSDAKLIGPSGVSQLLRFFDDVHPDAARQVLKRWQRDKRYLAAVEAVERAALGHLGAGCGAPRG